MHMMNVLSGLLLFGIFFVDWMFVVLSGPPYRRLHPGAFCGLAVHCNRAYLEHLGDQWERESIPHEGHKLRAHSCVPHEIWFSKTTDVFNVEVEPLLCITVPFGFLWGLGFDLLLDCSFNCLETVTTLPS
jgi:hypothetical protein